MYVPQCLLLALIIFKKYMWVNKIYIRSKKLCYKIKDQPRVRFGRTFAEVSDKEWPKVRFGWFLTMPKFGRSLAVYLQ